MFSRLSWRVFGILCLLIQSYLVSAQSNSSSSALPSSTPARNASVVLTTSSFTTTTLSRSGNSQVPVSTVVPTTFNVTVTPTSTTSASATATTSAAPTPTPIVLETKLDPAFGVLGALLILTGIPSAFWGHKNRWTSFFLIGFYTLSLVCFVLILQFGVLAAVNPPSKTLRGMFVLACSVAGFAGGAVSIFFWKAAKYFIGAWGGLAFGWWIQCFHNGGLIDAIGFRWIMYIGCAVVGFVLCTIPRIHYHIILIATSFVGASAFMLGVDCFTTAGLKEFYVWNLGFKALFPKFVNNGIRFPVSQTMQIELGLLAAVALMGIAVQLRILTVLQRKLREIQEEQKKRDEDAEKQAADRFTALRDEQDEWEREHPTLNKHGRSQSGYSSTPLMKDQDFPHSPDEKRSSELTLSSIPRPRNQSGVSSFFAGPPPEEELRRVSRHPQNPGALPVLDLGLGIEADVPATFISEEKRIASPSTTDFEEKQELLAEIQTIRRSIDALKSETPAPSSSSESRRPSFSSRRTLSHDLGSTLSPPGPSHLRPPRQAAPRARVQSMELSRLGNSSPFGASIGRPTSVPLREDDWDSYVRDRKLLQPPSGVTAPIATTPMAVTEKIAVPAAVTDALQTRKRRESLMEMGDIARSASPSKDSDNVPITAALSAKPTHRRHGSSGNVPVIILPPQKPIAAPTPQRPAGTRTRTFEELTERHREKLHDMQAPLTQAEKEHADVEAARSRWERSKNIEKEAVTKRQAEKAAQLAKESKIKSGNRKSGVLDEVGDQNRHSRSLSVDKLAALPGVTTLSSKRMSTMKVEDWRKHQHAEPTRASGSGAKRDSRGLSGPGGGTAVPFPDQERPRGYDRRRASGLARDPPN